MLKTTEGRSTEPASRKLCDAQVLRVPCSEKVMSELSSWRLGVNWAPWEEDPCPGRGSEQGRPGQEGWGPRELLGQVAGAETGPSEKGCQEHGRRWWAWAGGPSMESGAPRVCDGGNGPCLGVLGPWSVEAGAAAGVSGGRGQCLSHAGLSRHPAGEAQWLGRGQDEGVDWGSLA